MPRKSTIDTLPRDIQERLNFLIAEGALTLDDLTLWLDEQGHQRSRTAVGRHAKKINTVREKLSQSREIAKALVSEIGDDLTSSKQGHLVVEILRNLVFDHLTNAMEEERDVDPQQFFFLAKAIKDLAGANRLDQDYANKVRTKVAAEEREKAADSAETAAAAAGLSEDAARRIRNEILGIE